MSWNANSYVGFNGCGFIASALATRMTVMRARLAIAPGTGASLHGSFSSV
jgi:hypothetical protein